MNLKQTVLRLFSWVKFDVESKPEPLIGTTETNPTSQPPATISFYTTKARKIPGRRSPAGSR
jgi:hypothetical protein